MRGNRLSIKLARRLAQILRDKYPPMFPPVPGATLLQCCGSGFSGVPGSGSGFKRAKMTKKHRKESINFIFWSAGCSLLRAKGFFCSFDVLYGGLWISNFWSKKERKKRFPLYFSSVLIRVSDPHWFNADLDTDPDPAFFLIADPDSGSGSRIRILGLMT